VGSVGCGLGFRLRGCVLRLWDQGSRFGILRIAFRLPQAATASTLLATILRFSVFRSATRHYTVYIVRGYDHRVGGVLRLAGFSPPVGFYDGPIPVLTGATLGGPSRRFGLGVQLRVDLIGSRPILIPR